MKLHHRALLLASIAPALAACESPTTAPNAAGPRPGAPSLGQQASGVYECTELSYRETLQDVVVPPGKSCILAYARIMGTLRVMEGASLYSVGTQVHGDADFDNPSSVELSENVFAGTLVLDGDRGSDTNTPSYLLSHTTLKTGDLVVMGNNGVQVNLRGNEVLAGSIRVQANRESFLTVIGNRVAQDIHVVGNGGGGSVVVRTNTAGGMIRCDANSPYPIVGFNRASRIQGQCDVPDPDF
jgi:hypothetical protein